MGLNNMTIKAIKRAILDIDGVILRDNGKDIFATAHGYDIEFVGNCILTIRKTSKRHEYDAGSDYNPGGYIFLRRIKDIKSYILGY